jgi:predicted dehydrogenase
MNQGVHTVDLLLWLLGDIARVQARTATMLHAIETEDTAVAVLEFAIGAIGTLQATTAAYPGYPRRLEITGSLGTVVLEHDRIVAADFRDVKRVLSIIPPGARTRALPPPLSARFADTRPCSKTLSRLSSRTAHPPATAARAAGA